MTSSLKGKGRAPRAGAPTQARCWGRPCPVAAGSSTGLKPGKVNSEGKGWAGSSQPLLCACLWAGSSCPLGSSSLHLHHLVIRGLCLIWGVTRMPRCSWWPCWAQRPGGDPGTHVLQGRAVLHEASSVRGAASSSAPAPKRAQPPSDESFHCDAEPGGVLEPVLTRYQAGEGKGAGESAGACPPGRGAGARGAAGRPRSASCEITRG